MFSCRALLVLIPFVSSFSLDRRDTTIYGQYDTVSAGQYSLLADKWGADGASGHQHSTLISMHHNTVKWSTEWQWYGNGIKSFSNAQLNVGLDQQLNAIRSMPSLWHWRQTGSGDVVYDTAYDFFTSNTPGGDHVNEVMVWLGKSRAWPMSNEYNAYGDAIPTDGDIDIAGHTWNLHCSTNGANPVYTFVPANNANIYAFDGDLLGFFTHLIDAGYLNSAQYLTTAQAGVEATSGTATFTTTAYRLAIE